MIAVSVLDCEMLLKPMKQQHSCLHTRVVGDCSLGLGLRNVAQTNGIVTILLKR